MVEPPEDGLSGVAPSVAGEPGWTHQLLVQQFSHHVVAMADHRLALFTIPKVGCTELLKLSRRMAGHSDWQGNPHYVERPLLASRRRDPTTVDATLSDPAWVRAAVLRDPAERLLSAYLDKFASRRPGLRYTFRPGDYDMPFDEFVANVLDPNTDPGRPQELHEGTDPHWRPQHLVGAVGRYADHLTMVATFDDVRSWIERVLRRVGGWDEFGASGWPSGAIFDANDAAHRTGAASKIADFYDADTLERVYDAYAGDLEFPAGSASSSGVTEPARSMAPRDVEVRPARLPPGRVGPYWSGQATRRAMAVEPSVNSPSPFASVAA